MESRVDRDIDGDGRAQRACDACRARKIRCDRQTPCSNCRSSKIACATTAPAQKPQRQRVHISDEYEKKIDRIEDRLSGIEAVLEALAAKLGNLDLHKDRSEPSSNSQSHDSKLSAERSGRSGSEAPTLVPFEGETTMHRQSEFARELLEQAVGSAPDIEQNAEFNAALTSLQEMVSRQGQYVNAVSLQSPAPLFHKLSKETSLKLVRPPWEAVVEVLDQASVYPTMSFAVVFPFLKMRNMKEICNELYNSEGECSVGRRILVYAVLYNLFQEFSAYTRDENKALAYRMHTKHCTTLMETAMSQLDLFMPANYENIVALLLSAAHAIEMCKPSLAWVLVSNAASLCQNLGYHRIQTMKDDSEEDRLGKIFIFWFVYVMDKTLSLRLGRASVIQDWDMSLPYPSIRPEQTRYESFMDYKVKGGGMMLMWIKVAQIQGQAYERLFSPAAFLKTPDERAQTATELIASLDELWAMRGDVSATDFAFVGTPLLSNSPLGDVLSPMTTALPSERHKIVAAVPTLSQKVMSDAIPPKSDISFEVFADVGDIFFHADVVVHYSTCALIQKAVSPDNSSFNQQCLESSRAALIAHQRCHRQFNNKRNEELWSGYVHWAILQAPFTPFIVIFCNAITELDTSDLDSLAAFVHSLESCRTVSEGADKLYKMCHLFLQVSRMYIDARTKDGAAGSAAGVGMQQQGMAGQQQQRGSGPGPGGFYQPTGNNGPSVQGMDPSTTTQFDPYLSALGLMPNSVWPMAAGFPSSASSAARQNEGSTGGQQSVFPQTPGFDTMYGTGGSMGMGMGMGTQGQDAMANADVQNWFSGSRYLMNLMEEDIQMPDFTL